MFGKKRNATTDGTAYNANGRPSKSHQLFQHLLRALQFLSALTSLIIFSVRLAKILRLVHKASRSNGAVEGILAAAVLYTIIVTALTCGLRAGGPNILRWLFIIFDILFAGAFIAVAVLTSPKRHGSSGPCSSNASLNGVENRHGAGKINCNLPWGTFILAIFSTVLHSITAAYHSHKNNKAAKHGHVGEKNAHNGDGFVDGNAPGHNGHATRV